MSVTYEEAREIVRRALQPTWWHGTFCLDDRFITETDQVYGFAVGAREYLVEGDRSYSLDGDMPVVDKESGNLTYLPSVEVMTDPTKRVTVNPTPTLDA